MASKALQMRISEAERELQALKEQAAKLEAKLALLQKHLDREEALPSDEQTPEPLTPPAPSHASPPPLPPAIPAPSAPAPSAPAPSAPAPSAPAPVFSDNSAPTPQPAPSPQPIAAKQSAPEPQPVKRDGLELELGRVWFVRIGIGMLLTGFVFLSTYAYQNFIAQWPAGLRVAGLYLLALLLTGTGIFLERRRENLINYGRVLAAGGWAAAYYTTYATHHVPHLRIIESPVTAAVLMTLCALAFFSYAAWRKSSLLAVAALILAFYSTAINPIGTLGCFSGLLLSAVAMVFFIRFRWMNCGIASLLGAYLSYAYWQGFVQTEPLADTTRWFLAGYWLLFLTGALVPQARHHSPRFLAAFASLNNIFFFLLFNLQIPTLQWVPDVWRNALIFGGLLLLIAAVVARTPRLPQPLWQAFLPQGLALITWGLSIKLTGYHLFISLGIEAVLLAAMWRQLRNPTFRLFAWLAAGIATLVALYHTSYFHVAAPPAAHLTVAALLVVFAALMRGEPFLDVRIKNLSLEALFASLLALFIPSFAILSELPPASAGTWMLLTGLVLSLLHLAARGRNPLPELVVLAQPFALLGIWYLVTHSHTTTELTIAVACTAALFHLHGWAADQKREELPSFFCRPLEALFTIAFLLLLGLLVVREGETGSAMLLSFAILAPILHLYGSLIGRPILATLATALYLPVAALWLLAMEASLPTAATRGAFLASLGLVLTHFTIVHLRPSLQIAGPLREALFALLTFGWALWCHQFIDAWWLVLAWTGCALAFLPANLRTHSHLPCHLFLLVLGILAAAFHAPDQFLLRYLAVPTALLIHLLRKPPQTDPDNPQGFVPIDALGFLGVLALTIIASQHTLDLFTSNGLSICWSLLGLAFFALGLASQRRVYRLSGLLLLAATLAHILAVDVWKLGTLLRILSFLTLGLVLLALGYVYNRWSDTLRRFL